ncbi:hypothetical protein [Lignipirellula cremea]|uniref:hypothetical protein n=1 Tax=Lignipirellula cremea TaxID=2528010 RepID=UPI00119E0B78|nr:hypothetical protein [Lignipirellula cremea]
MVFEAVAGIDDFSAHMKPMPRLQVVKLNALGNFFFLGALRGTVKTRGFSPPLIVITLAFPTALRSALPGGKKL